MIRIKYNTKTKIKEWFFKKPSKQELKELEWFFRECLKDLKKDIKDFAEYQKKSKK